MAGSPYDSERRAAAGSRIPGRRVFIGLAALLTVFAADSPAANAPDDLEYKVKAAILYNLAKFVEWPAETRGMSDEPVVFCILGQDPFGANLDEAMAGKRINGRQVGMRRYRHTEDASGCHVLFVSGSEKRRASEIARQFGATGVLTVSDMPGFADQGGMIGFVIDHGRVRFEVNLEALEKARIRISSQVLNLALIVKRGGKVQE